MLVDWLKRSLPRSLYGRAALILVLPLILLQLVISVAFVQRIYEDATRQMTRALVPELAYLRDIANAAPDAASAARDLARVSTPLSLGVDLPAARPPPQADIRRPFDLSGRAMIDALRAGLPDLGPVDLSDRREARLWLPTAWGDVGVSFNRRLVTVSNPHQLIVLTLAFGALLTLVSFLFLRNQLRPIRRLAEAATAFGKGRLVRCLAPGVVEEAVEHPPHLVHVAHEGGHLGIVDQGEAEPEPGERRAQVMADAREHEGARLGLPLDARAHVEEGRAYHSAYFEMLGEQGYPGFLLWAWISM